MNTVETMKKEITNWNDLSLKERLALVKHNEQLELYAVSGSYFAVNAFVRCKTSGVIRYITSKNDSKRFEDNGEISGAEPSPRCWYKNYVMIFRNY
jgi:hypothetical protein